MLKTQTDKTSLRMFAFGLLLWASHALGQPSLTIWMSGEHSVAGVEAVAKRFERATGMLVFVQTPLFFDKKFPLFAPNGNGPDIVLAHHHHVGLWASQGLLATVDYTATSSGQYVPLAINSLKYQGHYYGYPLGIESLNLAYNKRLISNPPRTWYETQYWQKILSRQGIKGLVWPYQDSQLSFPILSAFGAYSFGHAGFVFDPKDVGLMQPGVIQGIDFLRELLAQGWLSSAHNQRQIQLEFKQQQQAMMLVKPHHWQGLKKLDFQVGLTSLPLIGQAHPQPLIDVYSAFINQYSQQQDIATLFIEQFLSTEQGLAALDKDVSLGIPAYIPYLNQVASSPWVQTSFSSLKYAQLTPNLPQISQFFATLDGLWQQLPSDNASDEMLRQAQQKITASW